MTGCGRARKASGDQLTAFELISRFGVDMALKHVSGITDPLPTTYPWYVLLEVSSSEAQSGLLELLEHIGLTGLRGSVVRFEKWRPGDQRWYVSDPRKFGRVTGWYPRTGVEEGLAQLSTWLSDNVGCEPIRHRARREMAR